MKRFLAWAGAVAGLLVLMVAGMWVVGSRLPVAHTATVSAEVPGTPEEVWAVVSAPGDFPTWRSDVDAVEVLSREGEALRWRESGPQGALTMELVESDAPGWMVARIADPDLPFGGEWRYRLEAIPTGTRVTLTEDGEVYDPFFRFFSRFVFGHEGTMRGYLEDLGARMGNPDGS